MAATPQHIVLLYLLPEKREETRSGFTLSQKLIATFPKFQIFATFEKTNARMTKKKKKKKVFNRAWKCAPKHGGEGGGGV